MVAQKHACFYGPILYDQIFCYFSSPDNFIKIWNIFNSKGQLVNGLIHYLPNAIFFSP